MGIQTTIKLRKADVVERIEYLLESKKSRIISNEELNKLDSVVKKLYPHKDLSRPLLKDWLTDEEFDYLKNNLEKLSNEVLEELLEDLNEDKFENYSITESY